MPRSLLQALLLLALCFNALVGPWGMAKALQPTEQFFATAATTEHGCHQVDPAGRAPGGEHDSAGAGGCCQSDNCHCGCLLPGVPSLNLRVLAAPSPNREQPPEYAVAASSVRFTPLLRPPSNDTPAC